MPYRASRSRRRLHIKPIKRKVLSCAMIEKSGSAQSSQDAQFQQQQDEWTKKWEKDIVTYSLIRNSKDIPDYTKEKTAINLALGVWDVEIKLDLERVKQNQNPDIKIEFTDSNSFDIFKNDPLKLAYAFFPGTLAQGIIKLNDDKVWSLDGKSIGSTKTYNLVSTLIHEIGHSLGLKHTIGPNAANSIMHSSYTGKLDLSDSDINRIVGKYNARYDLSDEKEKDRYERLKKAYHRQIKKLPKF